MVDNYDQEGVTTAVHIISVIQDYDPNNHDADYRENITNTIINFPAPLEAEIGDLIVEENVAGYRTDGVYIVGHDFKIRELDFEPDDYGTLPKEFQLGNFVNTRTNRFVNINYWLDALTGQEEVFGARWHNRLIRFNPVALNLDFDEEDIIYLSIFGEEEEIPCVRFDIGDGKIYYICDDVEDEPEIDLFLDIVNQPIYLENMTDDSELGVVEDNAVIFTMRPIADDYDE